MHMECLVFFVYLLCLCIDCSTIANLSLSLDFQKYYFLKTLEKGKSGHGLLIDTMVAELVDITCSWWQWVN